MKSWATPSLLVILFAASSLALTPQERKALEKAKQELVEAKSDYAQAKQEASEANKHAQDADASVQVTANILGDLEKQIKKSHDNEQRLSDENAKMRPVYDRVTKYWGLGAIMFGLALLFKHILILVTVIAVLGLILWGLSFVCPPLAAGISIAVAFIKRLFKK